ncbi:MAG: acyclic terpene utilization AtuA family protein [Ilumatobacteraceae bacterium]
MTRDRPVLIANCSGFFGDRLSAAQEMVDGGPIDVLTGDWLAELTMLILWKTRARDAEGGYARTFLTQMEEVLGTCVDRGIKVVSNAGGLNPAGCAERVRDIADRLGLTVRVAHIEGDDLIGRIDGLRPHLTNLDTGQPLTADPISANAYLGGLGIAAALREGVDVVVCPRVTDAALAVGPAAWWWDWAPTDWDRLAGAVAAGHVNECGAQTAGGNYAFFTELPDLDRPLGFPIAEVDDDGSAVITKHPGTGGAVTVETVTAQLLYEIGPPAYLNPDVVTRFDTMRLEQVGADRVRISGTRGEPAPTTTKVAINYEGGYRNRMTLVLTGLDQEAKAAWLTDAIRLGMGGADRLAAEGVTLDTRFVPAPSDAPDQEQASGKLHVFARAADERAVGRAFSSTAIELALANIPGFFATSAPGPAQSFGVYWPALVPVDEIEQVVVLDDGRRLRIDPPPADADPGPPVVATAAPDVAPAELTVGQPLGHWFGARSGDKGGNANVGVWARDDDGYAWLAANLSAERVRQLLPEARDLEVRRYELPNLRALNFVLVGYLGEGVASSTAFDPQAKGLGEYLRSRPVWRASEGQPSKR